MDQSATNGENNDGHIHYSHDRDHQDHRHLYNSLEHQLKLRSDCNHHRCIHHHRHRNRNHHWLLRLLCPPLVQPLPRALMRRMRLGPTAILSALVCLFLSSSGGIALAIVLIVRQQQRWRKKSGGGVVIPHEEGGGDDDGDVSLACLARDLVLFAAALALLYIALHARGARWGVYRSSCCSTSGSGSSDGGSCGSSGSGGSGVGCGGDNKSSRSSTSGGGGATTTTNTAGAGTGTGTGAAAATSLPLHNHICGDGGKRYLRTSTLLVARLAIAFWVGALIASAIVVHRAPDGRRIGAVPVLNLLFCIGAIIPFLILSITVERKHPTPFTSAGFSSKPSFLTCRVSAFADDLEASTSAAGGADTASSASEALLNMSISRRASIERAKQRQEHMKKNNNLPPSPPSPPQPSYNPGGWRSEWNDVAEQVGVECRTPVSEADYGVRVAEENGTTSGNSNNNSNNVAPPAPTYITSSSCYSYAAPPQAATSSSVPAPPPPPPVPLKLSKGGPVRGNNMNVQHNDTDNRHEQKQKQAGRDDLHKHSYNHNLDHHRNHPTQSNYNPNPSPNPNSNYDYNYNYHHSNGNNYAPKPPPPPPPVPSTSIASGERRSGLSTVRYAAQPDVAVQQPHRVFVPAPAPTLPAPAPAPVPVYAPISIPASADSGGGGGNKMHTHSRPTAAATFTTSTTTVEPPPPTAITRTTRRVYTNHPPDTTRKITDSGVDLNVDIDHGSDRNVVPAPPPPVPPHSATAATIGYESYGYSTMRPEPMTTTGETITTTTTTTATTDPATAAVSMLRNAQKAQKMQQKQRGHLVGLGITGNGRSETGGEACEDDEGKDKPKEPEVKIPGAYVEDCPE